MPRTTKTPAASAAPPPPHVDTSGLTDTEREQIGRRARALWSAEGFPQGRDREFWEQAELQVLKGRRRY